MLFQNAYAQQAAEQASFSFMNLLPILLIFAIFYFLLFRPQQKKEKIRREMLNNLQRGDKIVTSGGVIGTIHRVSDKELVLEIAEGVRVNMLRSTVVEVYSKEPESKIREDASSDDTTSSIGKKAVSKLNTSSTKITGKKSKSGKKSTTKSKK